MLCDVVEAPLPNKDDAEKVANDETNSAWKDIEMKKGILLCVLYIS